jgi:hypothetical protein
MLEMNYNLLSMCLTISSADATQPSKFECVKESPPAMSSGRSLSKRHPAAAALSSVDL